MQKELKFKIISEGLKNGVSLTCRKYDISRTLYYRWLKRFKSEGIDGLDDKRKEFIPPNKTNNEIKNGIFELVKTYPSYGPRAIKYLLEELGHDISESAVYNVLKRNNLTNRKQRFNFSKKEVNIVARKLPSLAELNSGECWIFWITEYASYKDLGHVYSYNLLDLKSQIACTRLYNKISFNNFEDLLTAVALSIAASLKLKINYICLFENRKIIKHADNVSKAIFHSTLQDHGFEAYIYMLDATDAMDQIKILKSDYIKQSLSFLMPLINDNTTFAGLKLQFQEHLRNYNLNYKKEYENEWYSPVQYHNKCTDTKLILPIWAYMDRDY